MVSVTRLYNILLFLCKGGRVKNDDVVIQRLLAKEIENITLDKLVVFKGKTVQLKIPFRKFQGGFRDLHGCCRPCAASACIGRKGPCVSKTVQYPHVFRLLLNRTAHFPMIEKETSLLSLGNGDDELESIFPDGHFVGRCAVEESLSFG